MVSGNVQSPLGVTLVGAGPLTRSDLVDSKALAPTIVAADGGANTCIKESLTPEAVIGDFDSITADTRAALPDTRFIEVSEQETTDFEKCLTRIDAPFIIAAGFASGRLDHKLANLSVMARMPGPPVILLAEEDIVFAAPPEITIDVPRGTRVSLFPMTPIKGRSSGLRWPIDDLRLDPMGMVGTSNEATSVVRLEFDMPGCLIIMPREALAPALSGLLG